MATKAAAKQTKSATRKGSNTKKPAKGGASSATSKAAGSDAPYTKPELREKIKKEITAGDKGGRPGQWSARKAQMVAHEYEAEGGGYRGKKKATQKHIEEWTAEKWQTQDGKPAGRNGTMKRYLPEKAWNELSPEERAATERKKARGTRAGKQFVPNTEPASTARQKAEEKTTAKKEPRTAASKTASTEKKRKASPQTASRRQSASKK